MTKILLVEDDKSLREIYGVRLLAEGYDIVSAGDGEEALAMAIKERPQLIVSDVMMPKISGFDMLDILRSTTETKGIKVIMMTALSSEDQRARGEALGADRYLVKSQVGIEDVVRTVHDVLGDNLAIPQTPSQTFGTPAPSAVARPFAPVAPRPQLTITPLQPPVTTPPPVQPQPVINTPPAIVGPTQPPVAPPTAYPLPQPTAPFSSNRPSSLGDRVIHPLTNQTPSVNVGELMNQELSGPIASQPAVPQPPTPPPAPFNPITPSQDQTII
ncbi:response regulator [Candidatus Saccharibacteria bacterium]|nr:response regulator [Candidatus Saccharibacteria bacterium]